MSYNTVFSCKSLTVNVTKDGLRFEPDNYESAVLNVIELKELRAAIDRWLFEKDLVELTKMRDEGLIVCTNGVWWRK